MGAARGQRRVRGHGRRRVQKTTPKDHNPFHWLQQHLPPPEMILGHQARGLQVCTGCLSPVLCCAVAETGAARQG